MKLSIPFLYIFFAATIAAADDRSVTFYSDGALVEIRTSASKGAAEIALPSGMQENSLRIRPVGNATIKKVEIVPARVDVKRTKEMEALNEQRLKLEDRMKALETREEIFRAAAKSQSGKTPRRTKANPDPMQSLRQGTEYAIAQLESVYTARRKTEQEIHRIDAKLAALKKNGTVAEAVARINVSPAKGQVKASYALAGLGWKPVYDLRLNGDSQALLTMSGLLPSSFANYRRLAAASTLAEATAKPNPATGSSNTVSLAEYRLAAKDELFGSAPAAPFSCILTNQTGIYLPPGEATIFHKGEYRGKVRFEGISSGRSRKVASFP